MIEYSLLNYPMDNTPLRISLNRFNKFLQTFTSNMKPYILNQFILNMINKIMD
jgi:hypothetical protein